MKLHLMNDFVKFLRTIPNEFLDHQLIFSENWDGEDLYAYACQMSGGETLHSMGGAEGIELRNTPKYCEDNGDTVTTVESFTVGHAIKWWSYLCKECWLNRFLFYTDNMKGLDSVVTGYYIPRFQWNVGPDGIYINLYKTNVDEQVLEWKDTLQKYGMKG